MKYSFQEGRAKKSSPEFKIKAGRQAGTAA
jgi:hypothetical protein